MSNRDYISTNEAAEILGLSIRRVVGLCNGHVFANALKNGRSWLIPREDVFEYNGRNFLSCAVGNTSYRDIVGHNYYVDKTLLIRDLIDDHVPVILFTRPRRFGKTLNLDMLKCFFEKSNEDTSIYFRDKKIWKCGVRYQKYQGSFPVISISFKDAKYSDWASTFELIKNVIRDEFLRHEELFSSDLLNLAEKDYLAKLLKKELSDVDYARGLLVLMGMLKRVYHSKIVVLIDEYDTPIGQGYAMGFYDEIISFMRNFLSGGLKDNENLAFGVLSGILRISKENLFSGLNNLVVNSVLDEKYSQYFGFTLDEVEEMSAYYDKSDKMTELSEWYDGYRFGNTKIYNPWSVANYFYNDCQARPYWVNTSDNAIGHEILSSLKEDIVDKLFSLMQGKTIPASLNVNVIYPSVIDGVDAIFSFLLFTGYLRPTNEAIETKNGTFLQLSLPNKEIARVYNSEILSFLKNNVGNSIMNELEMALYLNDGQSLKESLRKYMLSCVSCFDGASEGFYHGMMLGLVAGLSSKYYIHSNKEAGDGRFDLLLEPKVKDLPGVIMEFKAEKDVKKLVECANSALCQIEDKHYDVDLCSRGIKDIAKYGVAFCGKVVEIVQWQ